MNKPLEGLFVVELTTYWAAPSAGEFLRCLGARVVKIETGKAGDSVRYWGRTCGMPIEANENPSFDLFNGGKEFMHMDLNDPEHERVLHNMLAKADVFLTSMRLGGLKKHNLDYDTLKEKYPRLVMAHATGYGCKDGPLSAAPGLDAVAFFAMNGLISDLRLNPDDSPICPPTGMGDLTTGMPLFGAIMTALFARERTGKGDYVSASLYGTGNWVTSAINSGTQYFNPWPRSRFTQSPMGQAFETKDGKFVQIFVNAEDVRAHEVGKPQAAGCFAVRLRADSLTDLADQGRHDGGLGIGAGDHRGGDDAREHHGRDLAAIGAGELREDPQRQALHEAAVVDADRHDEHADAQPDGRAGELDRDVRHLAEFEYQQHDHGRKGRDPVRQGAGDQARQQEAEAPEILPALTAHHFRFRRQVGDQQHQDNTAQNAENRLFHLLAHEFHSSLMNGSQLALSLVNYLSSWF